MLEATFNSDVGGLLDVFLGDFWVYNMWISTSNQLQFSCMRSHNTRTMLATKFYIFYIRQSTLRDLENDVFQIYREITPNLWHGKMGKWCAFWVSHHFQTWVEDTNPTKLHGGPREEFVVRRGDCINPHRNLVRFSKHFSQLAYGSRMGYQHVPTFKSMGPWAHVSYLLSPWLESV